MKKKNVFKLVGHRDNFPFFKEILEMGYHVFSMENAKLPGFYPNTFPDYPGVDYRQLRVGDVITIRVFFRIGAGRDVRADGGYMDLEVEHIRDVQQRKNQRDQGDGDAPPAAPKQMR